MGVYEELVERGLIAQVTDEEEIKKLVNDGKAVFYIGFDPTADSLHVGHFMALCLMKRLQDAGNRPIALVGGGTGMVGDPSGRSDLRKVLTVEDIDRNCECFKKQMSRFIDFGEGKALMVNNADWLRNLNYIEFLREVGLHFSVNRMLTAECYKLRMEQGLTFLEFNYMIMQAYDFYSLFKKYGCNMQFGGDDQWSNMLAGTELIRRKLGKDAYAMTINLLTKSDGTKMGKTSGGAVWLDKDKTKPYDFYQYWRNVDDADVIKCLKMLTFLPLDEIKEMEKWKGSELNKAKTILAYELTKLVHGKEEADKCDQAAKAVFSGDMSNADMPNLTIKESDLVEGKIDIVKTLVLAGFCTSNGDARRNIEQGGVFVDDNKVTDVKMVLDNDKLRKDGVVVKKGKKNFVKVMLLSIISCLMLSYLSLATSLESSSIIIPDGIVNDSIATESELAIEERAATSTDTYNEVGREESIGVIKPGENEADINVSVIGSEHTITNAVIDPSSKGNIETFILKDNAQIAFYIINSGIDINNINIENYYYRTISGRTAKVRCRDFKYNVNTEIKIVSDNIFGKLKATDKVSDCLFIYDVKYRVHTSTGEEDRFMKFAFKIVPEDEYVMYQNIEVKPVIDDGNEIKRPKKVDS